MMMVPIPVTAFTMAIVVHYTSCRSGNFHRLIPPVDGPKENGGRPANGSSDGWRQVRGRVCDEVFAVSLVMRRLQEREIAHQIGLWVRHEVTPAAHLPAACFSPDGGDSHPIAPSLAQIQLVPHERAEYRDAQHAFVIHQPAPR